MFSWPTNFHFSTLVFLPQILALMTTTLYNEMCRYHGQSRPYGCVYASIPQRRCREGVWNHWLLPSCPRHLAFNNANMWRPWQYYGWLCYCIRMYSMQISRSSSARNPELRSWMHSQMDLQVGNSVFGNVGKEGLFDAMCRVDFSLAAFFFLRNIACHILSLFW